MPHLFHMLRGRSAKFPLVFLACLGAFLLFSGFTVEEDPVEDHLPRPLSGPAEPAPGRHGGELYLAETPRGDCLYDESGRILKLGSAAEYSYYPNGKVSRMKQSGGNNVEALTYFSQSGLPVCRTSSHRDSKGAALLYHTYLYDSHGQLKYIRCADAGGFTKFAYTIRSTYDARNRLSSFSVYDEEEVLLRTHTFTYREDGTSSLSITEFAESPDSGATTVRNHATYEYDREGLLLYRFFDITSGVLTQDREDYSYDEQGHLTDITLKQITSPNSSAIRNQHFENTCNSAGRLTSVISQTMCYEIINEVARPATLSRKKIEYFTYDAFGNLTKYSDGKGTWQYRYSTLGSLLEQK